MEAPVHVSRPRDFNLSLNGYRGVCAMLVFAFHVGSAGIMSWPDGSVALRSIGYLWTSFTYGVEMFFMISGFVIVGSLLRHRSVGSFLRDRFIRIFSAWVPALCAVTIVSIMIGLPPLGGLNALESAALFVGNLLLLPPIAPFPMIHQVSWSLSYEWMFYIAAALGMMLYRRGGSRYLQALWLLLVVGFLVLFPRSLFFVTGVIVFRYRTWFVAQARWLQQPLMSLLLFLIAWRATGAMKAHLTDTMFDFIADGRWVALLIAFAASLHLFGSVTVAASRQTRFLSGPVFQFLGRISYSFYLWHTLVMATVKRYVVPPIVAEHGVAAGVIAFAVISMAIALPVSWLSWSLFETHFAAFMRRIFNAQRELRGTVRAT
ncbi:MAG TPA: acyltransferase [Povalibacter sp.]|nr:acyltransferase [Povalibacter sp.]